MGSDRVGRRRSVRLTLPTLRVSTAVIVVEGGTGRGDMADGGEGDGATWCTGIIRIIKTLRQYKIRMWSHLRELRMRLYNPTSAANRQARASGRPGPPTGLLDVLRSCGGLDSPNGSPAAIRRALPSAVVCLEAKG